MTYACSGWLQADSSGLKATIILKTPLPTGGWLTLASAKLPALSSRWEKHSVQMKSIGESDRVVFELLVEGEGNVWVDKLSAIPTDNERGWRRDAVEAIKE